MTISDPAEAGTPAVPGPPAVPGMVSRYLPSFAAKALRVRPSTWICAPMSGAPETASVMVPDTTVAVVAPPRVESVGLVASGSPEINPLSIANTSKKARMVISPSGALSQDRGIGPAQLMSFFRALHPRGRTRGSHLHTRRQSHARNIGRLPRVGGWESGQPPAAMDSRNSWLVSDRFMRSNRNSMASVGGLSARKFRRR